MTETVRQPKQQRSRDSAQRVLEAGKELLEELGFEGFTIQQVSERAGFSVGAIYARFGSKENLVHAVHQHAMSEIADMTAVLEPGEWTKLAPEQFVCEAVRRVAELFRVHRKFLRASMHLGAIDETVAERGSQGSQMAARTFRSLVVSVLDGRIAHDDPELAADVCFRMVYSTLARQVMYGPTFESDRPIEWDALVGQLGNACAAYLLER